MIGNTPEYFRANNLIMQIMEIINSSNLFDDLKPLQASDIVNLSLDILRIIIQIHTDSDRDECQSKINLIEDISESPNDFVRFANISIDCQRSNNEDLKNVLHALGTADDIEELITKILIYGRL